MPPDGATNSAFSSVTEELKPQLEIKQYKNQIIKKNVVILLLIHISGLYGAYLLLYEAKWQTVLWTFILYELSSLGVVAGVHRLWSHNAYKVRLPLEVFLVVCATVAAQKSIYRWARDHRVHHKYTDTDADPHNANRGFFYSHVGWHLVKKSPLVAEKGNKIYLEDLHSNRLVMFQHRYYYYLAILGCLIMPTAVAMYFWGETFSIAWHTAVMFRFCFTVNMTWLINSAAHAFGTRPYNKNIQSRENVLVSIAIAGDGWHNYHHTFPWDYRSAELGGYRINAAAAFIDMMALIGQAYDLKTVSPEMVAARKKRNGQCATSEENSTKEILHSWGWGDDTVPYEYSTS